MGLISRLLIQKENSIDWGEFHPRWFDSLVREARTAYEERIKIYREQGWTQEEFYRRLGKGCFPLHPLTAYLLCNLDFTQDRTAIQFIKGYVKKFIQDESVEKLGQLNYIYPIALVDTFVENFSNESVYIHYKKALGLVAGSDDTDELTVLKALFLFYACGEKLTKPDKEEHQEILAALTGLPKFRLKVSLDKLEKNRDIIYYRPETKLYRFWEGISPTGIEDEIEDKIKNKSTSIYDVVLYCQSEINTYLDKEAITATQFVQDNKLVGEDWQFEYRIYSIDGLIKALETNQILRNIKARGILAYVLAETQEDLQEFRRNVGSYLSKSLLKNQIAIAIPTEETGDLARVLLKIKTLEQKDAAEKQFFGTAYKQLLQRWQEQVNTQLKRLLKSCSYHCIGLEKIPLSEQGKAQRVISVLLQELYHLVPPVAGIDKMRQGHTTGSKIVGFVARQIFIDSLTPQSLVHEQAYKNVTDTIFVTSWGLLKKTSQKYIVQEPTNERIRAAWDKLSEITHLNGLPEKTIDLEQIWKILSNHPYGYSEYNFTILLAGWLSYHSKEISLRGPIKVSPKKAELVSIKQKSLKDWANADTDVLQKPAAFVSDWIIKGKAKLIRCQKAEMPALPAMRMNYDQAQQYLAAVTAFLETNEPDPIEVNEVNKNREIVSAGIEQIDNWLQPVVEIETLAAEISLEVLLQIYPQLMERSPTINLVPDVISVQPTQQQRDRQTQALQNVNQKITEFIETLSRRLELVSTEEACNTYKLEIQSAINQLNPIANLASHFIETLQNAIRLTDFKLVELREQSQVKYCLSQVQILNKSLNDDGTQQDYISILAEIQTLAQNIPNGSQEAIEVQRIIQNLNERYRELSQQIEIWEERSSGVNSQSQILDLFEEISRQDRRFTEEASKQRLTLLQDLLKQELLKIQNRDDTEKLVRAELSNAQYKLQRIRDLSLNKLSEAFQVYQELINSSLLSAGQAVPLEQYHKKLDEFKAQGRTVITEKFAHIYNRTPNSLEDCESLYEQLQRSQKILANEIIFNLTQGEVEKFIALMLVRVKLEEQIKSKPKLIPEPSAQIPALNLTECKIATQLVERYKMLLRQGIWGKISLSMLPDGKVEVIGFEPFQCSQVDLQAYADCRNNFNTQQWRDLIFCSMGFNPEHPDYNQQAKTWMLARLLPLVESNFHIMELAPKGTGKSFVFENISNKVALVSGGKITPSQLFINGRTKEVGLLGRHDVVVLDEVQSLTFDNSDEIIGPLKNYLASGRYNRSGFADISSDCSLVMLANIELVEFDGQLRPRNEDNLIVNLPTFFSETALLDRFVGIIPGWEIPKFKREMSACQVGLKMDFLGETLLSLRQDNSFMTYVQHHTYFDKNTTVRDQNAILKAASGFLKLLYPHMKLTLMDYQHDCLEPAVKLRQLIRNSLYNLDEEFRHFVLIIFVLQESHCYV